MKKEIYVHERLDEMVLDNNTNKKVKKILLEGEALNGLSEYYIEKKIKDLFLKD